MSAERPLQDNISCDCGSPAGGHLAFNLNRALAERVLESLAVELGVGPQGAPPGCSELSVRHRETLRYQAAQGKQYHLGALALSLVQSQIVHSFLGDAHGQTEEAFLVIRRSSFQAPR
jgi:hypothetical protein